MRTMNISLPDTLKDFVEEQVSSGNYSSASEYVRELLRAAQDRKASERLAQLLSEGTNSGFGTAVTPEYWQAMRKDVASRITAHKAKHAKR